MSTSKQHNIFLFSIIAMGFWLRFYRIGTNLFWVDELGVARAAMMPTLAEALNYAHGHVMAMPLDYVVAWLMAHISFSEGWLRLPEVLWGTLSLAAGYLLYRQLLEERTALLGTFLLALSPIWIEYSQELRFYAPLLFFYTLSTAIGLKASRTGKAMYWLMFTVICLLGVFFHIYTALALISVSLWVLTEGRTHRWNLGFFSLSILVILIGAEYAMYSYGSFPGERSSLFAFESPWHVIFGGLGWMPTFPVTVSARLFGALSLLFALFGTYYLLSLTRRKPILLLLISLGLQIIILLGMAAVKHYFASARQFIMLIPLATLLSAAGIDALLVNIKLRYAKTSFHAHLVHSVAIVFLFFLVFPALHQYYTVEKGATRSILQILNEKWQPGQSIYITPGYERDVYVFYAQRLLDNSDLAQSFMPLEIETEQTFPQQAIFLISTPSFDATSLGFEPIFVPSENTLYPHVLWQRR